MESINWPQIGAFFVGALGLGLSGLMYLTRMLNRLEERMAENIASSEERTGERIARTEERITRSEERLGERIARLEDSVIHLGERMGSLEQRQTRVEDRLEQMEKRFDERMGQMEKRFDERMGQMDERLNQMQDDIKSLDEGLQNVEKEQARMLGFLEGRGVMGRAPAAETAS